MDASFLDFSIIDLLDTSVVISQCEGPSQSSIFVCCREADPVNIEFLKKILSAVQIDLDKEVSLLKITHPHGFSFSQLQSTKAFKKALIFDFPPSFLGLQLNLQKYQPFTLNGCTLLFADPLQDISNNKMMKTALWTALKAMFFDKEGK